MPGTFLRRMRGIVTMAILWGLVWAIVATPLVMWTLGWRREDGYLDYVGLVGEGLIYFVTPGVFSGAVFAIVFMIAERRNKLQQLSIKRIALWGFLGGAILPALLMLLSSTIDPDLVSGRDVWFVAISGALGSGAAAGTLALARRGVAPVGQP